MNNKMIINVRRAEATAKHNHRFSEASPNCRHFQRFKKERKKKKTQSYAGAKAVPQGVGGQEAEGPSLVCGAV